MSSPPNTPPKSIHVTAVTVSLEQAKWWIQLRSGELHIGPHKHTLICDDGTLSQQFPDVVELAPDTRIALHYAHHYKTPSWLLRQEYQMDTARLFASYRASQTHDFELSASHDGVRVVFSCQTADADYIEPENRGIVPALAGANETLTHTIDDRTRFRILVIGKAGVGKSSLINAVFGVDVADSSHFEHGKADIEKGLESVVNKRFILHDSLGFRAGENVHYDIVKQFIRSRQTCAPEDRLHAVWFCVSMAPPGGRLLGAAEEDFFRTKKETMGTIPIIVVYTKVDVVVTERIVKLATSGRQLDGENLIDRFFPEAVSGVEKRHEEINQLAGESVPHTVVSTKETYKHTLRQLIELTFNQVGAHDALTLTAAQRIDPDLKIRGTIDVGRQRYWKTLRSSSIFDGNTTLDCLSVIHTDVVAVWNFNDPARHLSAKEFKDLVIRMVEELGPAAPIDVYRKAKNAQQLFIAYIVDLTHILKTLDILNARDRKKLTRRAIKLAYHTYRDSGLKTQAHSNIQSYRELNGRDAALEVIENLIKPERYGDPSLRSYYAEVSKLDLTRFMLDREEEW